MCGWNSAIVRSNRAESGSLNTGPTPNSYPLDSPPHPPVHSFHIRLVSLLLVFLLINHQFYIIYRDFNVVLFLRRNSSQLIKCTEEKTARCTAILVLLTIYVFLSASRHFTMTKLQVCSRSDKVIQSVKKSQVGEAHR